MRMSTIESRIYSFRWLLSSMMWSMWLFLALLFWNFFVSFVKSACDILIESCPLVSCGIIKKNNHKQYQIIFFLWRDAVREGDRRYAAGLNRLRGGREKEEDRRKKGERRRTQLRWKNSFFFNLVHCAIMFGYRQLL